MKVSAKNILAHPCFAQNKHSRVRIRKTPGQFHCLAHGFAGKYWLLAIILMVNMGQMAADLVYELMLGIDLALQTCKTCYIAGKSHHQAQGAFFIKNRITGKHKPCAIA